MKINADRDRCEGHGICVNQAPQLLDLGDDDLVVVREAGLELTEENLPQARVATESCPVAALAIGVG